MTTHSPSNRFSVVYSLAIVSSLPCGPRGGRCPGAAPVRRGRAWPVGAGVSAAGLPRRTVRINRFARVSPGDQMLRQPAAALASGCQGRPRSRLARGLSRLVAAPPPAVTKTGKGVLCQVNSMILHLSGACVHFSSFVAPAGAGVLVRPPCNGHGGEEC